jgi:hypothetical protein
MISSLISLLLPTTLHLLIIGSINNDDIFNENNVTSIDNDAASNNETVASINHCFY